jgi:hypothetical protein
MIEEQPYDPVTELEENPYFKPPDPTPVDEITAFVSEAFAESSRVPVGFRRGFVGDKNCDRALGPDGNAVFVFNPDSNSNSHSHPHPHPDSNPHLDPDTTEE